MDWVAITAIPSLVVPPIAGMVVYLLWRVERLGRKIDSMDRRIHEANLRLVATETTLSISSRSH